MALIQYTINIDASRVVTIVQTVEQIGPGDEVRFVATSPNTALQCSGFSPFASIKPGQVYAVPQASSNPPSFKVTKSAGAPDGFSWVCGGVDPASGIFTAWVPGPGVDFPRTDTD
jgi:hypothetical protein